MRPGLFIKPEWAVRAAIFSFSFAKLALHLAFLTPYGWFRDELYYIACSEHLAWGYVDHPPLSVALLRAWCSPSSTAFGGGKRMTARGCLPCRWRR
jgi:hypothetical protein